MFSSKFLALATLLLSTPSSRTAHARRFSSEALVKLRAEGDDTAHLTDFVTQTDATWGLGRISSNQKLGGSDDMDFTFKYHSTAGKGTTIYVISGGIDINNTDFGGRATWGKTSAFGDSTDQDVEGYGTHCAGIAVSTKFGVAKSANVVAVKISNDRGDADAKYMAAAIDWVTEVAQKPAVAVLPFVYLPGSDEMDDAVRKLHDSGVIVVAAAGEFAGGAGGSSPGRVKEAITVGASAFNDSMAWWSNSGELVDIYAPGMNINSTWINNETSVVSGTSRSTCFVAGAAAYFLGLNNSMTRDDVISMINDKALVDALAEFPSGGINKLLHIPDQ